jgi:hypothetical protein
MPPQCIVVAPAILMDRAESPVWDLAVSMVSSGLQEEQPGEKRSNCSDQIAGRGWKSTFSCRIPLVSLQFMDMRFVYGGGVFTTSLHREKGYVDIRG